jgi:hypothetical protein
MSHFTVLVVGPDVEKALYPFWELDLSDEEIQKDPRAVFDVKIGEGLLEASFFGWKDKNPKYQKEYNYANANAWLEDWHGYQKGPGGWGYWYNPKAKWDWCSVGGRWSGFFLQKHASGTCDQANKGEIDWEAMQKKRIAECNNDYDEYLIDKAEGKGNSWRWHRIKEGETREQYVAANSGLSTFAIIKDGQWYEKGDMGWWGCVADEKESNEWQAIWQNILDGVGDDEILTLVDCHI